jgi:nicotinamide-nucleotide amidase
MTPTTERCGPLVERIAREAVQRGVRIAVAESLSAGALSSALGAGSDAADWYQGAVVAYSPEVKFQVLDVTPGPVNTARCAAEMALGAVRLLDAELAVAVTGVGGPGSDEGVPAGTVFIACADRTGETAGREHHFEGDPTTVVEASVEAALGLVVECLSGGPGSATPLLAAWSDCHRDAHGRRT